MPEHLRSLLLEHFEHSWRGLQLFIKNALLHGNVFHCEELRFGPRSCSEELLQSETVAVHRFEYQNIHVLSRTCTSATVTDYTIHLLVIGSTTTLYSPLLSLRTQIKTTNQPTNHLLVATGHRENKRFQTMLAMHPAVKLHHAVK